MSLQLARENVTRYVSSQHTDLSMIAPDAVFTNMATGDQHRGVDAVREMLNYVYHVAFDARAETTNLIITEDHAVLEGWFVGRHTAEFAGIPATNRDVRVPLCVVYDLEQGMIKQGRVYFEVPALLAQLNGAVGATAATA